MKFLSNVIAFVGPACGFALQPVGLLSAYWNIPVVTGLGDQVSQVYLFCTEKSLENLENS